MSENFNISVNMPFGNIDYSVKNLPENFDTSTLQNIDWQDVYDRAEKTEKGGTAVEVDSLLSAAFNGELPEEVSEMLATTLIELNEGQTQFDGFDDLVNISNAELEYTTSDHKVEKAANTKKEAVELASKLATDAEGKTETVSDKASEAGLNKEKLGDKLKTDKDGNNYIEVDNWDPDNNDNMDCMSRIIYNAYGVNLYTEEGQKIYEELAAANGFDADFNNQILYPGDEVFLPEL